jgi:hypothetical protein
MSFTAGAEFVDVVGAHGHGDPVAELAAGDAADAVLEGADARGELPRQPPRPDAEGRDE